MIKFRHCHFLMLPMSSNAMLQCSNQGFIHQILLRLDLVYFCFYTKGQSRLLCERSMMIEFRHRHFLMLPMSSNAMLQCSNQGFIEQSLGHLVFCQNDSPIGGSFEQKDSLITHILFELCLF